MAKKPSIHVGDTVSWEHSQGKSTGKVVKKQTTATQIKGHKVKATKDDPQFIVQSGKTGAKAAHKPSELNKA